MWGRKSSKRNIFKYWDGYKTVYGDPLAIAQAIDLDSEYRSDIHPAQSQSENSKQAAAAMNVCLAAYRRAFKLKEYNSATGKGLTESEIISLHWDFCDYLDGLKKNISEPVTTQPSGAVTSSA